MYLKKLKFIPIIFLLYQTPLYSKSNSFKDFEFIICSNGTSANLDCMIMKLNFCSIRTFNSLNLFPIEKFEKIFQVKNHKELVNRIKFQKKNNIVSFTKNKIKSENFKTLFL